MQPELEAEREQSGLQRRALTPCVAGSTLLIEEGVDSMAEPEPVEIKMEKVKAIRDEEDDE
jgi:hypothetical protein